MTPAERRKQEEAKRRSIQPGRFNSNDSTVGIVSDNIATVVEIIVDNSSNYNTCDSSSSYTSSSCDSSSFGD